MSNQALSQDEIDALFKGGGEEAEAAAAPSSDPEVRLYDFRRPSRISKDRQRTLEGMYGALAKSVEGWLAGRVRTQVEVDLKAVEQLTFGEFALSLPDPCVSFVFNLGPPGGPQAVINLGQELAFHAVERFLGSASETYIPDRALTILERRVVRIVAEKVAGLVQEIWVDHATFDFRLARFEAVPDMLQAANREDPMLVAHVQVRFKDAASPLMICLPFSSLDEFFASSVGSRIREPTGTGREVSLDRENIEGSVRRSLVPVAVRLAPFELSVEELAELEPGGTLVTGIPREAPVEVRIGGRTRYTGFIGTMNDALAVQVLDAVEIEAEEE
jgi:flagellar motor switch protein FliM